jgi:hypothetical protein
MGQMEAKKVESRGLDRVGDGRKSVGDATGLEDAKVRLVLSSVIESMEGFLRGTNPKEERHISTAHWLSRLRLVRTDADEIERLRSAIRSHRDAKGDDRCWQDDETLYAVLPEGYTPPERDSSVELSKCEAFIRSRHNPSIIYLSPEREIERLRSTIESISTMLGWGNVPPLSILEREISLLKSRRSGQGGQ